MKQIIFAFFLLMSLSGTAQWSQTIDVITKYPPAILPADSVFNVNAPSRTQMGEGVLVPVESGGGGAALNYYELVFSGVTNGTSSPEGNVLNIISNTFPEGWTMDGIGSGAFLLTYDSEDLDFVTNVSNLAAWCSPGYQNIANDPIFLGTPRGEAADQVGFFIYEGITIGTAATLETGLCTPPTVCFRYYTE